MDFTGAITLILIVSAISASIALANRKARLNKQKLNDDPYKGFHLGEMTHHDLPRSRYAERTSNQRWSERNNKKKDNGGTKNEKGSKEKNKD